MIISYFGLPEMRILTKANLTYKGKTVYSPETVRPASKKEWKIKLEKNRADKKKAPRKREALP